MHQFARMSVVSAAFVLSAGAWGESQSSDTSSASSTGKDESVRQTLDLMQQELLNLRRENQSMKGEIDELRAQTDADWLTETRAKEIRGLVEEVLADADTRASLLQDGLMAGWSDHFFLASPDGRFNLILEGQLQIRWIYNYHDQTDRHVQGFENTRTRLTFHGHVFNPDIQYLIRGDFLRQTQGFFDLLDAWVRYNMSDDWSVRFGQFKLPFNREELVSSEEQLAVERSLVNEATNLGRSQGVELTYTAGASRASVAISDGATPNGLLAQLVNAAGNQVVMRTNSPALQTDVEYAVTTRYEHLIAGTWGQFNDFTSPPEEEFGLLAGIAGHAQQGENTGAFTFGRDETRMVGGTADLSVEWGGANAFVSATYHYIDSPSFQLVEIFGVVAQVGVYLTPKWEVFLRGEYAQVDVRSGGLFTTPDLNLVTLGANYYIDGHDLKWTTDIGFGISDISNVWASDLAGFRVEGDEVRPQIAFRTQFQLLF